MLPPATAVAESEVMIQEALSQADNTCHSTVTCTAGTVYNTYFYEHTVVLNYAMVRKHQFLVHACVDVGFCMYLSSSDNNK